MKTLVNTLGLNGNPFEHYVAESEPNISAYAVRPPYLQAIWDRVNGLSSFILFGDRGAGKSATRITVYNEIWGQLKKNGSKSPFVVNLTDYSNLQDRFKKGKLDERDIVKIVAFVVLEQILVWLTSLEENDRQQYLNRLDVGKRTLILAMLKGFYLSTPELDREVSTSEALKLLNSAWTTKSAVWASKRWDSLSQILASIANVLARKELDGSIDIAAPAEALLNSLTGESPNVPRAIIGKLVEIAQAFDYSGIAVLVDKVDETINTSNSAEATARLIQPLLTHVQLLEVPGFCWTLFLWSNVKRHFSGKYPVRLDRIAHANITWNTEALRQMIDARLKFFSSQKIDFGNIFVEDLNPNEIFGEISDTAVSSPRELIKLMDIVFREHDIRGVEAPKLIDYETILIAQDKYCVETIGTWFDEKVLQALLRLGRVEFVNKDVQSFFKISDQGARVKIKTWEDAGLVRQRGTAPSELGGKPVYLFVVSDARVARIITNQLDPVVGVEAEIEAEA